MLHTRRKAEIEIMSSITVTGGDKDVSVFDEERLMSDCTGREGLSSRSSPLQQNVPSFPHALLVRYLSSKVTEFVESARQASG